MIFLGLLIVQNKLKEKTKDSLAKYDDADLRMLMATGDNILTAICVSKDCNLIPQDKEMVSCEIENENGKDVLKWKKLEDSEEKDIENNIEPIIGHNQRISDSNLIADNNSLDENTSYSINDLYPPVNINSIESKNEENTITSKKKDEKILKEENSKKENDEKIIKKFY